MPSTYVNHKDRRKIMYLNQFSLRVPEGNEVAGGYVEMIHGRQYTLRLRNETEVRCDVFISIDGKDIGAWRINAGDSLYLERPSNDRGRFTFYRKASSEAIKAKDFEISKDDYGLIKAVFKPEKVVKPVQSTTPEYTLRKGAIDDNTTWGAGAATYNVAMGGTRGYTPGMTGLSGHSSQNFHNASPIREYDTARITTISLRFVDVSQSDEPRPLVSSSNPTPPPVD